MRTFTLPVPAIVAAHTKKQNQRTHYVMADSMSAMADAAQSRGRQNKGGYDWNGYLDLAGSARVARAGDMTRVAKSDSLLARFERFSFSRDRKSWRRDVAGNVPNVPAMLAGAPATMRRRVKLHADAAPIAIIVDLTTSGNIGADAIERRGAAILALTRVLASRRPVELWAGAIVGADADQNGVAMFTRIDTAPLDLAHAAFAMVSPAFTRQMLYSFARGAYGFGGSWPYGNNQNASRLFLADIMRPALPHVSDVLAIPAAHYEDQISANPEQWIESTLAALDGAGARAA